MRLQADGEQVFRCQGRNIASWKVFAWLRAPFGRETYPLAIRQKGQSGLEALPKKIRRLNLCPAAFFAYSIQGRDQVKSQPQKNTHTINGPRDKFLRHALAERRCLRVGNFSRICVLETHGARCEGPHGPTADLHMHRDHSLSTLQEMKGVVNA